MHKIKLVRDKIPEKIISNWETPDFYIAEEKEYLTRLIDKVKEEYDEVLTANDENILEELWDFKETIMAVLEFKSLKIPQNIYSEINIIVNIVLNIIKQKNINEIDIEEARIKKYEKLWWFNKRIILKTKQKIWD